VEGETTVADRSAPAGRERERESAWERKLPLTGGSHLSGGAGARAGYAELGCCADFPFPFSLDFLILFLFLFSRVSNFKFKLGFKLKLIQTSATLQRINKLNMMQHVMTHNVLAKINN
jgi:hypothetical protein